MRKLLFALLAIALLIVVGLVVYKGFRIGKIEVWGIKQIVAENEQIDKANSDLEKLANDNFQAAITKLNSSGEAMQAKKKEYEEQAVLVSNSKYYMQTEKYKIDFLWTRIGNYAKENKVTPKMEVASESTKGILLVYQDSTDTSYSRSCRRFLDFTCLWYSSAKLGGGINLGNCAWN